LRPLLFAVDARIGSGCIPAGAVRGYIEREREIERKKEWRSRFCGVRTWSNWCREVR
jgi:hypothetical protein